jgi:hypothetical protein
MIIKLLDIQGGGSLNHPEGIIRVWTYEGDYTRTWTRKNQGTILSVAIGDTDNDGNDELVAICSYTTGKGRNKITHYDLQIFENGDSDEPSRFVSLTNNGMMVVVADANNDGTQEIVGAGEYVYVFNDDGNTITELWRSENIKDDHVFDLDVGDADNDGENEIVYAGLFARKFGVYDYLGGNNWGNKVYSMPSEGGLDRAKVADVDGDGLNEVIGGGNYNKLTVWKYSSGSYVIDFNSDDLGGFTQGVAAGDFDNDGLIEIAVGTAGANNMVYVFKYIGSTYTSIFEEPISEMVGDIFAGDSDNDGINEFIVGTRSLLIYKHISGDVYSQVYSDPEGAGGICVK